MLTKNSRSINALCRLYQGLAEPAPMTQWRAQQGLSRKYAKLMNQFFVELVRIVDTLTVIRRQTSPVSRAEVFSGYLQAFEQCAGTADWRVSFMRFLQAEYRW